MNAEKINYDGAGDTRRFISLVSDVASRWPEAGVLTLCCKDARTQSFLPQRFKPSQTQPLLDEIRGRSGHSNVWLSLHLMRSDLPRSKRGGAADVIACLAFVLDDDAANGKPARLVEGIEPTWIILTSQQHGSVNRQIFYFFDRPILPALAKTLFELGYRKCGGDSAAQDIVHVWRLPGTNNFPDQAKIDRGRLPEPQFVRVVGGRGNPVSLKAFQAAIESMDDFISQATAFSATPVEWVKGGETNLEAILKKIPAETQTLMNQTRRFMHRPANADDNNSSEHAFRVMQELMECGLSDDEIYLVADGRSFVQKFWKRGDLDKEIGRQRKKWSANGACTKEKDQQLGAMLLRRREGQVVEFPTAKESPQREPEGPHAGKQRAARTIKNNIIEEPTEEKSGVDDASESGRCKLPNGYRYDKNGSILHRKNTTDEHGAEVWSWLCSPLEILAATRDQDGKSWGLSIRVKNSDDRWHNLNVPMSAIATESEQVLGVLASHGLQFPAIAGLKTHLKLLFSLVKPRRRARCVSQVGWHPQSEGMVFALPDETFGKSGEEEIVFQSLDSSRHAYKLAGTLEGWKESVAARARGNSRLQFALAAAFAGPLLRIREMEGGGFHFRGPSSCGKTTALSIAGSVWGGGGHNGYLRRWRTTDNALEGTAMAHCDTLLCLDELSEIEARAAGKAVYMLANGQGKGRMTAEATLHQTPEWRALFVSTGEISVADKVAEDGRKTTAGQQVRIIDIAAEAGRGMGIFENLHGFEKASDFADAIKAASAKHYGHASRQFLRMLTSDIEGTRKKVASHIKAFEAETCPAVADGQVKRVCHRFALVAAAGSLAVEWSILPWAANETNTAAKRLFKEWLAARGASGPLEVQNALAQVRSILERDGASRFTPLEEPVRLTINRLGFSKSEDGGQIFYALPEAFKNELCKGSDSTSVARALRDAGALITTGNKLQYKCRLPGVGQSWCYAIDGGKLFNPDGDSKTVPQEDAA